VLEVALHTNGAHSFSTDTPTSNLSTSFKLGSETAKEWGVVNEIVPPEKLLARAHDIAERLAKLPPLTTRYTRIALTQRLRRIVDDGIGYGLALEGISAANVARATAAGQ
jgi:enoyl-CoA hydratase/carnithine racemase